MGIKTTHVGSLVRPDELVAYLRKRDAGEAYDEDAYAECLRSSVVDVVQRQKDAGIDIVSDGEEGKPSYATYVKDRLTGFEGTNTTRIRIQGEARDFPEYTERRMATTATILVRPTCNGPIAWKDFEAVERDVANFKAAVE